MHISLRSAWRGALFSVVVLACVTAYTRSALRSYAAHRKSTRATAEALVEAIRLDPDNSDYHQLGLVSLFVDQDTDAAIRHYRAAVDLNPHMAKYWLDLGEAYNTSGNEQAETEAVRRAIAWEAANLYLVQGKTHEALQLLHVVLSNEQQAYTLRALDTSWRATHDADLIMREVLPPSPTMYAALLQMMIDQNRAEEAARVWRGMTSLGGSFDPKLAFHYFDYEMSGQRPESAASVWKYLLQMKPGLSDEGTGHDLVLNGGFERDLLNGGFDWRFSAQPHVKADLDTTKLHGGNRSLLLTSDGEPWTDGGIYQLIPSEGNARYKFSAFEKAYELLTPSGPRFRITDAYSGALLYESADVLGSSVWSQVSGEFSTGPGTRVLKIAIVRNPSFQRISGRFWVDDVSITRQ